MRSRLSLSVVVTLLAVAGVVTSSAPPASAATERWRKTATGGWFAWSSPAIGDVNSDGKNDTVIGGQDGRLYVYDANGNALPGWPAQATSAIASAPAIGDVDGDGRNEVVVGTGTLDEGAFNAAAGAIDIFDGNGALRCQKLVSAEHMRAGVYGAPAIGDVTGDGVNEVVVGAWDHMVYVLDARCNTLSSFDNRDSIWSSPALYDVNNDGAAEIFIGGDATRNPAVPDSFSGGIFRAFSYNGTAKLAQFWERRSTETFQSGAAIGDINGDGRLEVVTGAGAFHCRFSNICDDSNKVWAFHLDNGSDVPGWPKRATLNTTFNSAPALGDLDGDGIVDVVVGSNQYTNQNPAGGAIDAFYSKGGSRTFRAPSDVQIVASPVIGDVDGTAGNEVLIGNSGALYVLDSQLNTKSKDMATSMGANYMAHLGAAAIGELGPGRWAIVSTGFTPNRDGWIYAYDIPTPKSTPWPMLGKNARRLGTDASVIVPIECNAGYRLVAADGGVFAFGNSAFYGSTGGVRLNKPIVGAAATKSNQGYWFVASDGGIFNFGDAKFWGSTGAVRLNQPIVGMAATPSGNGYWLVASDGGIFNFGDAKFYGSTGNVRLAKPIVGMSASSSGAGYWFVASDGGIFNYGDAKFFGSTGAVALAKPVVGMRPTGSGKGYWFVASDGGIFSFGDAEFCGSTGRLRLASPIIALS